MKNDASAFCTYEEYEKAVSAFITLGNLRAESVQGQLDGTVPSTTAEQTVSPEKLIPAGEFNIAEKKILSLLLRRSSDNLCLTVKAVLYLCQEVKYMPKILICDDEAGLRAVLKRYATFEGYEVTEACDGMEAVQLCKTNSFDIIIMDIMMPELDGFSAVKEIRKTSDTPVIMLSARGEEYDKVLGFEVGVDDYVVKPFSSKEIMLRVNAILRRTVKNTAASSDEDGHIVFEREGFKADLSAYKVFIDGVLVDMAPKEYDLLFFLIRNKNIALPREKILTEVWGFDYYGDDRTLDTHMKLLRKSLGPYAHFIKTLRGLGYRFDG